MIAIAALVGLVVGTLAWVVMRARARRLAQVRLALQPPWIGPVLGVVVGAASFLLAHGTWNGVVAVPLAVLVAVMAVTDVLSFRVYDLLSLSALVYALLIAFGQGRLGDAILGCLIYGAVAFVLAMLTEFGTADIVGFAILGAAFGVRAYGLIFIVFGLMLGIVAVLVALRRNPDEVVHVPGFAAIFPSLLIGLTGVVTAWEARIV